MQALVESADEQVGDANACERREQIRDKRRKVARAKRDKQLVAISEY
jgi:hypothetical protein